LIPSFCENIRFSPETNQQFESLLRYFANPVGATVSGGGSFSPDGKRIVSGSGDKTLKVWDISSLATSK